MSQETQKTTKEKLHEKWVEFAKDKTTTDIAFKSEDFWLSILDEEKAELVQWLNSRKRQIDYTSTLK